MDFGINEGFQVEGTTARVDLAKLNDDELRAAHHELEALNEARGLWVPAGAGSLVVAGEVSMRDQLLSSLTHGVDLYVGTIDNINGERRGKDRIPVVRDGIYREIAEDWLTDARLTAAEQLPASESRPLLLVPRLTRAVTTEEIVDSWRSASYGKLRDWRGLMQFLNNWTADQLSGFDPELEDDVTFAVIPTAYDKDREGTVAQQKGNLEKLLEIDRELDVTTIFEGVVLARRYRGQLSKGEDSYTRAINLKPWDDRVPSARVCFDGYAFVDRSRVDFDGAARLRVK